MIDLPVATTMATFFSKKAVRKQFYPFKVNASKVYKEKVLPVSREIVSEKTTPEISRSDGLSNYKIWNCLDIRDIRVDNVKLT